MMATVTPITTNPVTALRDGLRMGPPYWRSSVCSITFAYRAVAATNHVVDVDGMVPSW